MKRVHKTTAWIVGGIILLAIFLLGYLKFGGTFKPAFLKS